MKVVEYWHGTIKNYRYDGDVSYIDLYVSTISRLLVMSVIIFGTPNYLRYIKTHKLIIPIVTER